MLGKVPPPFTLAIWSSHTAWTSPGLPWVEIGVLPPLYIQVASLLVMVVTLPGSGSRCGHNAERQQSHLPPGPAVVTQARKGISATSKGVLTEVTC